MVNAGLALLFSVASLQAGMEKIVREFPGTMGISVKNVDTGQTFHVNADVRSHHCRQQDRVGRGEEPDASGFKGDVRTDAAYVETPKARHMIAICVRRVRDKRPGVDNRALVTGARLSRMVYDSFNGGAR